MARTFGIPVQLVAAAAAGAALAWATARRAARTNHRWVHAVGFRSLRREIGVAVDVALRCGAAMRACRGAAPTFKDSDGTALDPVTATDQANEALVTETLAAAFPAHAVIGEEATAAAGAMPAIDPATPTWIVDPIDGTQNFVHGLPLSCVSIGLCVGGAPAMGVVYDPYRDELYVGVAAEAAYCNGERLRPDNCTTLPKAMVLTDPAYERSHVGARRIAAATTALLDANTFGLRVIGSAVLSLLWVASGRASAFYIGVGARDIPKAWDWCAAHAIGTASGVTFLRLDADDAFGLTSDSVVCAATPELARTVQRTVRAAADSVAPRPRT